MQLPCTATVEWSVQPDGSIPVTSSIVDAANNLVGQWSQTFPAGTRPLAIMDAIRDSNHAITDQHLLLTDLPSTFTVQIGLNTNMRNLDLL